MISANVSSNVICWLRTSSWICFSIFSGWSSMCIFCVLSSFNILFNVPTLTLKNSSRLLENIPKNLSLLCKWTDESFASWSTLLLNDNQLMSRMIFFDFKRIKLSYKLNFHGSLWTLFNCYINVKDWWLLVARFCLNYKKIINKIS